MAGDAGLVALRQVVEQVRASHLACRVPSGQVQGCPWPLMHDEDVRELHNALTVAGWELTPITERRV